MLSGIEPHVHWRQFCDGAAGRRRSRRLRDGRHPRRDAGAGTRTPACRRCSARRRTPRSRRRLGLSRPQYEGITGLAGVLHVALDRAGLPAIAMRVGVPHYATGAHNPKAAMALLRNLEHLTGVPTGHAELGDVVTSGNASSTKRLPRTPTPARTSPGSRRTSTGRPRIRSRHPTISPKSSSASCRTRPTTSSRNPRSRPHVPYSSRCADPRP